MVAAIGGLLGEFAEVYEARFGAFPGRSGGMQTWARWAQSIRGPEEFTAVVERLKMQRAIGTLKGKPMLGECEAALLEVRRLSGTSEAEDREPEQFCSACRGSGHLTVVLLRQPDDRNRPRWSWTSPGTKADPPTGLYSFYCHCPCSAGEWHARRYAKTGAQPAAAEVRRRAAEWCLAAARREPPPDPRFPAEEEITPETPPPAAPAPAAPPATGKPATFAALGELDRTPPAAPPAAPPAVADAGDGDWDDVEVTPAEPVPAAGPPTRGADSLTSAERAALLAAGKTQAFDPENPDDIPF